MTTKKDEKQNVEQDEQMEERGSKIIKTIVPAMCPHCNKEMLVAIKSSMPMVDWALKKEDIQKAKQNVMNEISESSLSAEEKRMAFEWVQGEDTLFGPEEVDYILQQIIGDKK